MNFNYLKRLSIILFFPASIAYSQSGKVVLVSMPDDRNPVETSIAINPKSPKNIIAAFLSYDKGLKGFTDFTCTSFDGGLTWKEVKTDNPQKRIQGDDAVAFGKDGIAYHSYLSFYGLENEKSKRPSSGIFINSSSDGGITWPTHSIVVDHINTSAPMEDKPYVVVDNSDLSKYKNNVYVAWTHFQNYGSNDPADSSQIYFSSSIDSGKTFTSPIRISTTGGDCRDSSNTVEGAITSVGPEGEIYIVWAGPKGLVFTESVDGGKTFSPEKVIGFIYHGWDMKVQGIERANGMPVTKTDLSNGKYKGSIYVNWSDDRFGDPDIFLKYSRDGGKTWSNTIRVNDDSLRNGKAQFFTWMSVDPVDGSLNIVFYDRDDTFGNLTGVTLARSIDGGKTFVNYKLNVDSFDCNNKIFFGDYTGIDAYDGFVIPIFMHFIDKINISVSAALYHFNPGTQEQK